MNNNIKDSWNLKDIFESNQICESVLNDALNISFKLYETRDSFLNSAQSLLSAFQLKEQLEIKLTSCFVYAKMNFDQDMSNLDNKALYEKCDAIGAIISERISFFVPQLIHLTLETWVQFKTQEKKLELYQFFMEKLFDSQTHILSAKEEELLTKLNSLGDSFSKTYDDLTINDLPYKMIVTPEGVSLRADNTNYSKALLHPDREFRKNYFNNLFSAYDSHINTFTSIYYGSVKNDTYTSQARKYFSSLHEALDYDKIDIKVYTNLLDTVSTHKSILQNYLDYRKKEMLVNELHFYDLFVPLSKDVSYTFSFEEAQALVIDATMPLGLKYQNTLLKAFNERWIDRYPKPYKDTGAYAIHAYGYHPFSLLNFNGTLNDVFTIAHELGHVMHSYYSMKYQPYIYSDYSIFTAEVASTVNEQLLFHHIYNQSSDMETKKYLIANQLDNIRSTFFRQTLFADFEWQVHKKVEANEPLTSEILKSIYKACYIKYYGTSLVIDDLLLSEWARIPHFYNSYYVYQYATGISAAIAISNLLLGKERSAKENYLTFLKSGGSDYPINLLKIAGVDMAKPEPILATLYEFENLTNQLKSL